MQPHSLLFSYLPGFPPFCEHLLAAGECIWSYVSSEENVSYDAGDSICKRKSSVVLSIKNEKDYNTTLKSIRKKISGSWSIVKVWIEGTVDPTVSMREQKHLVQRLV